MGDQTLELVGENGNLVAGCQYETPTLSEEEFKESRDSIGVSGDSDDTQLSSIDEEEPRLPILKKIDVMETKIRKLRKEHATLSNEVKDMTSNEFPGSEILNTLQHISADHELLKKQHAEECGVLKQKYLEECAERKRLYNEVIELKGNIRVFCRCRPLNQDEIASGCTSVTEFDSSQENKLQITSADHSKKEFKFDHVFGPEDNQESVFSQTSPVVTSVLDGYNVCIFAYGQTGTGKTFTMEGTSENRGVNYRTLEELFRISNERSRKMRYEVFVSMLEVYNEKIRDLLAENSTQPAQKLEVKQGAEGTQEVPGLVEARVYNTDEVWELLKKGNRARSVGSTNANEFSSRSHCLLRVTVKGEELVNKMGTKSNLWLVDLAGSERVGKIEAEGERLKESQFINKSLSALGDVIAALASKAAHVPYRNSKLTHILQSSLGGDCKTLMFVQISPSSSDLGETLCSLNFASRVRGIENGPAHKHVDHLELLKYKQMAEKVKHDEKEMKKLQDSVQSLQLRLSAREHVCRNLQDKVRDLENQLAQERKLRLKEGKPVPGPATDNDKPSKLLTKPPLGGFQLRPPLRQINTFLPPSRPPLQSQSNKTATHFSRRSSSGTNKENSLEGVTHARKPMLEPRRVTIALRPSPSMPSSQSSKAIMQPRRRVSVATPMQENNASYMSSSQRSKPQTMMQPRRRVSIATPMQKNNNSFIRTPMRVVADEPSRRLTSATKRQSFFRDPVRVKRYSKLFSPSQAVAATPVSVNKSSSRFMASPPTQLGSWKPKHPTVIALQKKHVLWSPLRSKGLKSQRQRQSSIFP